MQLRPTWVLALIASAIATVLLLYYTAETQGPVVVGLFAVIVGAFLIYLWKSRNPRYRHLDPATDADHEVAEAIRSRHVTLDLTPARTCSVCGQPVRQVLRPILPER